MAPSLAFLVYRCRRSSGFRSRPESARTVFARWPASLLPGPEQRRMGSPGASSELRRPPWPRAHPHQPVGRAARRPRAALRSAARGPRRAVAGDRLLEGQALASSSAMVRSSSARAASNVIPSSVSRSSGPPSPRSSRRSRSADGLVPGLRRSRSAVHGRPSSETASRGHEHTKADSAAATRAMSGPNRAKRDPGRLRPRGEIALATRSRGEQCRGNSAGSRTIAPSASRRRLLPSRERRPRSQRVQRRRRCRGPPGSFCRRLSTRGAKLPAAPSAERRRGDRGDDRGRAAVQEYPARSARQPDESRDAARRGLVARREPPGEAGHLTLDGRIEPPPPRPPRREYVETTGPLSLPRPTAWVLGGRRRSRPG